MMDSLLTVLLFGGLMFVMLVALRMFGAKAVYSLVYMATVAYYRARRDYPHFRSRSNGRQEGEETGGKEEEVHDH